MLLTKKKKVNIHIILEAIFIIMVQNHAYVSI